MADEMTRRLTPHAPLFPVVWQARSPQAVAKSLTCDHNKALKRIVFFTDETDHKWISWLQVPAADVELINTSSRRRRRRHRPFVRHASLTVSQRTPSFSTLAVGAQEANGRYRGGAR